MIDKRISPVEVKGPVAIIGNKLDEDLSINETKANALIESFIMQKNGTIPLVLEHSEIVVGEVTGMRKHNKSLEVTCVIDDKTFLDSINILRNKCSDINSRKSFLSFLQATFPAFSLAHNDKSFTPIHVGLVGVGARRATLITSLRSIDGRNYCSRNNLTSQQHILELAKHLYSHKQTCGRDFFLLHDAAQTGIDTNFMCASLQKSKLGSTNHTMTNLPVEEGTITLSVQTLKDILGKSRDINVPTPRNPNEIMNNTQSHFLQIPQQQLQQSIPQGYNNNTMPYGHYQQLLPLPFMLPGNLTQYQSPANQKQTFADDDIEKVVNKQMKMVEKSLYEKLNDFTSTIEKNTVNQNESNTIDNSSHEILTTLKALKEQIACMNQGNASSDSTSKSEDIVMANMSKKRKVDVDDESPTVKKVMTTRPITPQYISELISNDTEK